jgi:AraC-like DNA-binding protein
LNRSHRYDSVMSRPTATVRRPSAPALAPFVASIGYLEGQFAHRRERAMPSGMAQLLINLDRDELHSYDEAGLVSARSSGAALQGAAVRPSIIDASQQRAIIWVSFRLGGAFPFFPMPASDARDQLVDLAEFWGRDGATLRERLLAIDSPAGKLRAVEGVLLARAARPLERDPAVAVAGLALHRGVAVAEVADRLGWTPRRLGQRFAEQVGLTPKLFGRVRRFQRLLRSAGPVGAADGQWARLAGECGYHDQAHLIHEFRAFAGITPAGYRPRSAGELNHVPLHD